jgi:hypothetical protein
MIQSNAMVTATLGVIIGVKVVGDAINGLWV